MAARADNGDCSCKQVLSGRPPETFAESPALDSAPANPYLTPPDAQANPDPALELSPLDEGAEPPARLPMPELSDTEGGQRIETK